VELHFDSEGNTEQCGKELQRCQVAYHAAQAAAADSAVHLPAPGIGVARRPIPQVTHSATYIEPAPISSCSTIADHRRRVCGTTPTCEWT
jgi:hypothetical protein